MLQTPHLRPVDGSTARMDHPAASDLNNLRASTGQPMVQSVANRCFKSQRGSQNRKRARAKQKLRRRRAPQKPRSSAETIVQDRNVTRTNHHFVVRSRRGDTAIQTSPNLEPVLEANAGVPRVAVQPGGGRPKRQDSPAKMTRRRPTHRRTKISRDVPGKQNPRRKSTASSDP